MALFDVVVTNLTENITRFMNSRDKVNTAIRSTGLEIAKEQGSWIVDQTPEVTGAAREAVEVRVDYDDSNVGVAVGVFANLDVAPHWEWLEGGALPHEIRPTNADALLFESSEANEVFAKVVNHPGYAGKFIFQHARELWTSRFEQYKEKFLQAFHDIFDR